MEKREEHITLSANETKELGKSFAEKLTKGNIVLLTGELGSGKTTFVQGLSYALNIKSRVNSPTFVLVRKYRGKRNAGKINLYHIDLYRLESVNEIQNLGIDEIFEDTNGIFFIEWGERLGNLKANFEINFDNVGLDKRRISIYEY